MSHLEGLDQPIVRPARCPRFASILWTLTWVEEHSRGGAFCFCFPIRCCPCGFDFDDPNFPQCVVTKAAPLPLRWFLKNPRSTGLRCRYRNFTVNSCASLTFRS